MVTPYEPSTQDLSPQLKYNRKIKVGRVAPFYN